jgi:hypothetical protein
VNDRSGERVNDSSPKESHSEQSHNGDLDDPPTNRKKRDSRLESSVAVCKTKPTITGSRRGLHDRSE